MFKLALGAGHGLKTAGKRCLKSLDPNETREWVLNDRICDYVEQGLKEYADISILRVDDSDDGADDVELESRVKAANDFGADFYLSVHHDAGIKGGSGGGITAYSYKETGQGKVWRDEFYNALIKRTGLKGNRADGTKAANFYVLRKTNAPAVLLELGFMDSKTDVPIILTDEYAKKCAAAIVEVIVNKASLKKKAKTEAAKPTTSKFTPFKVKVIATGLNIRDGAGGKIVGAIRDKGVYTIVEEKNGWGKLKSGAGWISLNYTKRV